MLIVLFSKLKQKNAFYCILFNNPSLTPDPVKYTHFVMVVFWLFTYVESRVQILEIIVNQLINVLSYSEQLAFYIYLCIMSINDILMIRTLNFICLSG